MATVATPRVSQAGSLPSETALTNVIDRWIYVFMAAFFIAITLTGFIPDSLAKIAAVETGQRPPFPLALHAHSILMGTFLVLLFAQTVLAATARLKYHQRLGVAAAALVPALVIAGVILVPTMYHQLWNGMQAAPADMQAGIQDLLRQFDNIMLVQIRIGILFPLFMVIALMARKRDAGLHKRMMFLAVAIALPAAIDRMTWIPHTLPDSPLSVNLYLLVALAPMFVWDLVRTRTVHKAYWIWLAFMVPSSILIHMLWGTAWWHETAPRLVGL